MLIDRESFESDLRENYKELMKFGVSADSAKVFLAPYEYYNQSIAEWTRNLGLKLINLTPGIGTQADYTTPDMKNYKSSEELMNKLSVYENGNSLNGAIILIHLGTHPSRTDKLYTYLQQIIENLKGKGYIFRKFQSDNK